MRQQPLAVEQLEDRLLLAVDVFRWGGTVFVLSSDASDVIDIEGGNIDDVAVTIGNSSEPDFTFEFVENVFVFGRGGHDTIDVDGLDIEGTLLITGGLGDDSIDFDSLHANRTILWTGEGADQIAFANSTNVLSEFYVFLGTDDDSYISDDVAYSSIVVIASGKGGDVISNADNEFYGPVFVELGIGSDIYEEVDSSFFENRLFVFGNAGFDSLDLDGTDVDGRFNVFGFERLNHAT